MNRFAVAIRCTTFLLLLESCAGYQEKPFTPTKPTIIAPKIYPEAAEKAENFHSRRGKNRQLRLSPDTELSTLNDADFEQKLRQNTALPLMLAVAYKRNPKLKEFRKRQQAIQKRYPQSMFLNNILEQYTSFTRLLDIATGPSMHKKSVTEKTPYPGSLEITGKIISTEAKLALVQYRIAERDLVYQITYDYWELWFIEQTLVIYQEQLDIVNDLEEVARGKFKAGLSGYSDVLKAQITREKIAVKLEILRQQQSTIQVRLLSALNLSLSIPLGPLTTMPERQLTIALDRLYSLAKQQRQEIQAIRLQMQKLQQIIELSENKLYPDFTLGLSYFENRTRERSGKNSFPQRPQATPDLWFGQRESYLQEMRLQREALDKKIEALEQQTTSQIRELYWLLDTANRHLVLYRDTLLPLARENLRVTRVAYRSTGTKVDFLNVLNAERRLLEFQLALLESKRNYAQKLVKLEKIAGQRLGK